MSNTNSINWHCSTRNLSMQRAPPKKNDCKQCGARNSCTKHNKRSKPTSGKTSTTFVYYWNHLTRVSPFFLPFLLRFYILFSIVSSIFSSILSAMLSSRNHAHMILEDHRSLANFTYQDMQHTLRANQLELDLLREDVRIANDPETMVSSTPQ